MMVGSMGAGLSPAKVSNGEQYPLQVTEVDWLTSARHTLSSPNPKEFHANSQ
jgi:hypothetical protein